MRLMLAIAALAALPGCDALENVQDEDDSAKVYAATSDRLPGDAMEKMVKAPMSAVWDEGLARGEAEFQRLLEQNSGDSREARLEVADLQTSFGLGLYHEALEHGDAQIARAAIDHLRAAVPAYEKTFGRRHAEVALALTTLADAMVQLIPGWQPERIGMYREALSIRAEKLGSRNPETVASMVDLGEALIEDPAAGRLAREEALALYNEAKVSAPYGLAINDELAWPKLELGRAEALASLGRGGEAIKLADRSIEALTGDENCDAIKYYVGRLVERLGGTDRGSADQLTNKVEHRCKD